MIYELVILNFTVSPFLSAFFINRRSIGGLVFFTVYYLFIEYERGKSIGKHQSEAEC